MWLLHQPFPHPAPWAQQVPGAAPWTYQPREQASGEAEGGCVGVPGVLRGEGPTGQGDLGGAAPRHNCHLVVACSGLGTGQIVGKR